MVDPVSIIGGVVAFGRLSGLLLDIYNHGFSKLDQARKWAWAKIVTEVPKLIATTLLQTTNISSLGMPSKVSVATWITWRK